MSSEREVHQDRPREENKSRKRPTKEEIDALIAKAPEGSAAFDMTFNDAREAALAIAQQRFEQRRAQQVQATQQVGRCVAAYHAGLIQEGMSPELADRLAESYHQWMLTQLGLAADGVRAVSQP